MQLQHWWRHDGADWGWEKFATLPGSELVVPNSVPAFLQTTLAVWKLRSARFGRERRTAALVPGSFEPRRRMAIGGAGCTGSARVRAVHLLQSDFGPRLNSYEVIAETGEGSPGVGYGRLLFYWGDNAVAVSSPDTVWNGPHEIMR